MCFYLPLPWLSIIIEINFIHCLHCGLNDHYPAMRTLLKNKNGVRLAQILEFHYVNQAINHQQWLC